MVNIAGCMILTVTDETGRTWIPVKQACEALGKQDPGAYPRKMRARGFEIRVLQVPRVDGKGWKQACVKEEDLPKWFLTLRASGKESQVYFIEAPSVGLVKIGVAQDLKKRLKDLAMQSPVSLRLIKALPGGLKQEATLHRMFEKHRSHGEWFHLAPIASEIEALVDLDVLKVLSEPTYSGPLPRPAYCGRNGHRMSVEAILASETYQNLLRAVSKGPLGITQLADALGVTPPSVSVYVRRLEMLYLIQVSYKGQTKLVHRGIM
jgi:DNA-binding transcriptional ArsR family regulator